ncbi:MAG: TIGR02206 family membrane protein, partial [Phycisphaerales bacterium]
NESLPMHLCRWNGWIVALCLIHGHKERWRWARALTFFWGLGLSVQGMITPMWSDGAASMAFWFYWIGHLQIVGVAVYDFSVRGFTPHWKDLRFAMVAGVGYALVTGTLNKVLGTNYSYLGDWDYERASIVDRLGDYPERMLAMGGGALVLFVLMYYAARVSRRLLGRNYAKVQGTLD